MPRSTKGDERDATSSAPCGRSWRWPTTLAGAISSSECSTFLRKAGLPLPVQQHRVEVAGRVRHLDYAYPEKRIYLEFDGFGEHGQIRETFDDDRDRDAELGLLGWFGLHFTSRPREADVVNRVARALAARAA